MNMSKRNIIGITFIHMICSIAYQMLFMKRDILPYKTVNPVYSVAYSDVAERVWFDILSVFIAFLIIYSFWYLIIMAYKTKQYIIFGIILLSIVLNIMMFPSNWLMEVDNLTSYSLAVRAIPEYWQSIYHGAIYRGCMILFPNPIVITFVQSAIFLLSIAFYVQLLAEKNKLLAFAFLFFVFIFPDTYEVMFDPYRGCFFTVLSISVFSVILSDILKEKQISLYKLSVLSIIISFLAVYRKEGILFVLFWIIMLCVKYYKERKKLLCQGIVCILVILILGIPQWLGEQKYYAKDYQMINKLNSLGEILRSENANYDYEQCDSDLEIIFNVLPVEYAVYGLNGYRGYNYEENGTLNQSLLSVEEQQRFIQSVNRLIMNNKDIFINFRLRLFCKANGISYAVDDYMPEQYDSVLNELQYQWEIGYADILKDAHVKSSWRISLSEKLQEGIELWMSRYNAYYLTFSSRLAVLVILIFATVLYYVKKKKIQLPVITFTLFVQMLAIVFNQPEGRNYYYYTSFYLMLLCIFGALFSFFESKSTNSIIAE